MRETSTSLVGKMMSIYQDLGEVDLAQMALASTAMKATAESAEEEQLGFLIDASVQASLKSHLKSSSVFSLAVGRENNNNEVGC